MNERANLTAFTRFAPGLIPAAVQGRWKPVRDASSVEIERAIATDERLAREYDATGDDLAGLHWRRWLGLHRAWVAALAREIRADIAGPIVFDPDDYSLDDVMDAIATERPFTFSRDRPVE